jgi:hypothetical protein
MQGGASHPGAAILEWDAVGGDAFGWKAPTQLGTFVSFSMILINLSRETIA